MNFPKPTIAMVIGCSGGGVPVAVRLRPSQWPRRRDLGPLGDQLGHHPLPAFVTKSVSEVMKPARRALHIMTGETFDGKRAQGAGPGQHFRLPREELRERNPPGLRHAQGGRTLTCFVRPRPPITTFKSMSWDAALDYLRRSSDQTKFRGPEKGDSGGPMKQFRTDKSYRPGPADLQAARARAGNHQEQNRQALRHAVPRGSWAPSAEPFLARRGCVANSGRSAYSGGLFPASRPLRGKSEGSPCRKAISGGKLPAVPTGCPGWCRPAPCARPSRIAPPRVLGLRRDLRLRIAEPAGRIKGTGAIARIAN